MIIAIYHANKYNIDQDIYDNETIELEDTNYCIFKIKSKHRK